MPPNTRPRIDTVARLKSRFSQKRKGSTTRPSPQTVGRTRSASGTLTRPRQPSIPTPTAPQPAAVTGTAPAPAPAPAPATPPAEAAAPEDTTPDIDIAAIQAAITAIEAQFGLTREQLLADESEIGRTYRLLIAQANRANEVQQEAVLGNALERGILHSGIFAENVAEQEALTAEAVASFAAQQAAKKASVQTAIQQAESTAAQAKLTAAQQRGGQVLSLEELEALIKAGLA